MKVETKATCEKFLDTLASQLGLSMNLSLEEEQNSRLVINENEITFFEISEHLDDQAFCTFSSRLIARVILEHELMAKLVRSQISIDGVFSLLGQDTIQSCLDGCLESSFQPGNVTPAEKESLINCVNKQYKTSRHCRSTVLEWIFSNGANVDKINNKLVELGEVLNNNMRTITQNEFKLQVKERKISQSISSLDKRVQFNLKHETALAINQKRIESVAIYSNIFISAIITELMDLDQINEDIKMLTTLIMETMNQESPLKCLQLLGEFRCLNFAKSSLNTYKNTVSFTLYAMSPTSAMSNFISCLPNMETKVVSTLHNNHLKKQ